MLNTSDYEPDIGYRARISYPGEGRWFKSSPRYQDLNRIVIEILLIFRVMSRQ